MAAPRFACNQFFDRDENGDRENLIKIFYLKEVNID